MSDSAEDSHGQSVLGWRTFWKFPERTRGIWDLVSPTAEPADPSAIPHIDPGGSADQLGANIGSVLLADYPNESKTEAKPGPPRQRARMTGARCRGDPLRVRESGHTASVPVGATRNTWGSAGRKILRALLVSDLVTRPPEERHWPPLRYCGAVSAGVGPGRANRPNLLEGTYEAIAHTIVTLVAIISGTICDGAKPSCGPRSTAAWTRASGLPHVPGRPEFKSRRTACHQGGGHTIANIARGLAKEAAADRDNHSGHHDRAVD